MVYSTRIYIYIYPFRSVRLLILFSTHVALKMLLQEPNAMLFRTVHEKTAVFFPSIDNFV